MKIFKDNFEETLPLFEESITDCDYYALDLEFSGNKFELRTFLIF